ncbi:RNA polymerase sigma factor [Caldithrix abyssi]
MLFKKQKYENLSDNELVQLSLKDKDSFYYIVQRYGPKILRYIKRTTNVSQEDAEDILQEVFIKVYRNLNSYKPYLPFSSWIYRIAHNEVINHYHKTKTHKEMSRLNIESEDVKSLVEAIQDDGDVQQKVISLENAEKIKEMLAELPAKYREVLILRYLEEKSYNEISDILRKPPGSVATLINRAKSRLQKIAEQHELKESYE